LSWNKKNRSDSAKEFSEKEFRRKAGNNAISSVKFIVIPFFDKFFHILKDLYALCGKRTESLQKILIIPYLIFCFIRENPLTSAFFAFHPGSLR